MKNIAAQMVNFDREQMRRIANNMPEQYDEKPQVFDTRPLRAAMIVFLLMQEANNA